jgi:hypothetical protein
MESFPADRQKPILVESMPRERGAGTWSRAREWATCGLWPALPLFGYDSHIESPFAGPVLNASILERLQSWAVDGRGWQILIAGAVLALASVLWIMWQSHVRGTRRWRAALDAYAEREIGGKRPANIP